MMKLCCDAQFCRTNSQLLTQKAFTVFDKISHKVQYLLKMAKSCSGIKSDNIITHLYCVIKLLVHIILNMISV